MPPGEDTGFESPGPQQEPGLRGCCLAVLSPGSPRSPAPSPRGRRGPTEASGTLWILNAEAGLAGGSTADWERAGTDGGAGSPELRRLRLSASDVVLGSVSLRSRSRERRGCCVFIDGEVGMRRGSSSPRGPGFSSVVTAAQESVGA